MEDDVGGKFLLLRDRAAFLPQRLEEALVARAVGGSGPRCPRYRSDGVRHRVPAKAEALFSLQNRARSGREPKAPVLGLDFQEACGDELAVDRKPFPAVELPSDPERRQAIVSLAADAIVRGPGEDVGEIGRPERLTRPVDVRERLLRRLRSVVRSDRLEAGVTVSAGAFVLLSEITQQHRSPALDGLAIAQESVELPVLYALALGRGVGAFDELPDEDRIAVPVAHPRIGRKAVASGAAGLLIVGLEALRKIEVSDETDVGLVDPEPEGDGGDHGDAVFLEEAALVPLALRRLHARVIREGGNPLRVQKARRLLHLPAAHAIDDAARSLVPFSKELKKVVLRVPLGDDLITDVRSIEPGNEDPRVLELQVLEDLPPGEIVRGRRQRDPRDPGKPLSQDVELSVLGTEVMSPLADAVGLVDREKSDTGLSKKVEKAGRREPLRSDVQEIDPFLDDVRFDPPGFASR